MPKSIYLLDNQQDRDILCQTVPSIRKLLDEYDKLKESNKCTGCTRNKYKKKVLNELFKNCEDEDLEEVKSKATSQTERTIDDYLHKTKNRADSNISSEDYCDDCIRKHLATALVLLTEYTEGYESHLEHAKAEIENAQREGLSTKISINNIEGAKAKITAYLSNEINNSYIRGLLNLAEELCTNSEISNQIREIRKKF